MSSANQASITNFYESFQKQDASGMNQHYHPEATFRDPVFDTLPAWQAQAMWSMLCERAKDLVIRFEILDSAENSVHARWEADYTFSKTNRTIYNKIDARFEFKDGKIISHVDHFSLWRWAGMALGLQGRLLGWAPFVQSKIRQEAQGGLQLYIKRKRLGPPQS
ncbi:MAG: nuclear transport factor 2 family protein [Leptospiraceae bacterium]|nr:nuclear transport factor 2 family protein [Leptospiraceae bacterium]